MNKPPREPKTPKVGCSGFQVVGCLGLKVLGFRVFRVQVLMVFRLAGLSKIPRHKGVLGFLRKSSSHPGCHPQGKGNQKSESCCLG